MIFFQLLGILVFGGFVVALGLTIAYQVIKRVFFTQPYEEDEE